MSNFSGAEAAFPDEEERATRPVEIVDSRTRERCVLVETAGANGGRPHRIDVMSATIGRSQSCDVIIGDETLSRIHARIVRTKDEWTIEDAGSRNGCFVNGIRVATAKLQRGDRVRLGAGAAFRFDLVSEDEERSLVMQYESGTRDPLTVPRRPYRRVCPAMPEDEPQRFALRMSQGLRQAKKTRSMMTASRPLGEKLTAV